MNKLSATVEKRPRLVIVDIARGLAIVLMFVFHFCFDLNYFGFVRFDFYRDPFWLNARTFILSLFLLVVGISLFLAHHGGIRWNAVRRRSMLLAAAAAVVTAGSYLLFPGSYIFFGVLHFILLASLLGLPFVRFRWLALLLGIGCVWLDASFSSTIFNRPLLNWIGLMTYKPITEDYVPLLPWFGVVLLGIFIGSWLPRTSRVWLCWQGGGLASSVLGWAGRHSLLLYLLHQPVLIGLLYLATQLI